MIPQFLNSNLFPQAVTTSWATVSPRLADVVAIENKTGADVLVRTERDPETDYITLSDGKSISVPVLGNSKEVLVKASAGASGLNIITYKSR